MSQVLIVYEKKIAELRVGIDNCLIDNSKLRTELKATKTKLRATLQELDRTKKELEATKSISRVTVNDDDADSEIDELLAQLTDDDE